MTIFNYRQQGIAESIDLAARESNWRDWKWQVRHTVTSAAKFQELLGIAFSRDEVKAFQQTVARFTGINLPGGLDASVFGILDLIPTRDVKSSAVPRCAEYVGQQLL